MPNTNPIAAGILCAMKVEAKPFLKSMDQGRQVTKRPFRIYEGSISGQPVALVISGVGKKKAAAATEAMIDRYELPCLIVSGTSGGVDERLKVNDTVVATETVFHDVAAEETLRKHPGLTRAVFESDPGLLDTCRQALERRPLQQQVLFGRVATGDSFLSESNRAQIIGQANPLVVEMETAEVALLCQLNGIPFIAARSVSDNRAKPGIFSFMKYMRSASESSFRVVEALLAELPDAARR